MARPSIYSKEIIERICEQLSLGVPLAEICREPDMPSYSSVYGWQLKNPAQADADGISVFELIARARNIGEDAIADGCLAIADDGRNDYMERLGPDGQSLGWQLNGEHVQRSKLRVWARLELLKKWNPKKYGDKPAATVNVNAGASPISVVYIDGAPRQLKD